MWYKQLNSFKEHFNLLFSESPGHGHSKNIYNQSTKYDCSKIGKYVLEVLDKLKIKLAHFAGISLGTIIIHGIMDIAQERVKSAIMAAAITKLGLQAKFFLNFGNLIKLITPYMTLYKLFAWVMMPKKNHKKSREIFVREAKLMGRKEFLKWYNFMNTSNKVYLKIKNKELNIPKLYIMGKEDHIFIDNTVSDISWDKNADLYIIDKCGHVCNIEKSQEFNNIALNYLKYQQNIIKSI